MNLQEHYDEMRALAVQKLERGEVDADQLIDSAQDGRRGITLLTRPPAHITEMIEGIMADFRRDEPDQYYYPAADIHLTVMSIITCYNGFTLDLIDPEAYTSAVHMIAQDSSPFKVRFSGLTASPGGIIIQGFPLDDGLRNLREKTRKLFRESGLQQSIDQRYSIQTAHSTVIRFRTALSNNSRLLQQIEKYRRYFIGEFEASTLELVYNDWYQRTANTVLLEKYILANK